MVIILIYMGKLNGMLLNRGDKMKQIGTKVYYCLLTGNVIKIIGDMMGYVRETTFDEDYEIYTELNLKSNIKSVNRLLLKIRNYID